MIRETPDLSIAFACCYCYCYIVPESRRNAGENENASHCNIGSDDTGRCCIGRDQMNKYMSQGYGSIGGCDDLLDMCNV